MADNEQLEDLKFELRNKREDYDRVKDALGHLYPDEPKDVRAGWLAQQAGPEVERLREQVVQLRAELEGYRKTPSEQENSKLKASIAEAISLLVRFERHYSGNGAARARALLESAVASEQPEDDKIGAYIEAPPEENFWDDRTIPSAEERAAAQAPAASGQPDERPSCPQCGVTMRYDEVGVLVCLEHGVRPAASSDVVDLALDVACQALDFEDYEDATCVDLAMSDNIRDIVKAFAARGLLAGQDTKLLRQQREAMERLTAQRDEAHARIEKALALIDAKEEDGVHSIVVLDNVRAALTEEA